MNHLFLELCKVFVYLQKAGDVAELCSGDIVADIRTIYQSKIGSESGRAGAQTRLNMDTASLVSDHHQFSSFLQLTLFLDTLHLSTPPFHFLMTLFGFQTLHCIYKPFWKLLSTYFSTFLLRRRHSE